MSSRRIRVGIIGVSWGEAVHAPAFRAVEEYEVVALCGRRPESVKRAGERLGISDLSTDWRTFVERKDLDLISVASPIDLHVDMGIAVLAAGKNLLCEKPLATNETAARRLYDAWLKAGTAAAVCHELRWGPRRLAIWDQVRSGAFGQLYHARLCQSKSRWHPSNPPQAEWIYKRAEGGGFLLSLQSHDIDYLRALFGEIAEVCADLQTSIATQKLDDGRVIPVDADDTGTLLLRFEKGGSAIVTSSVMSVGMDSQTFEAYGSKSTIFMDRDLDAFSDGGNLYLANIGDKRIKPFPLASRKPVSGKVELKRRSGAIINAMALMLEDWLPAFDGRPTPSVPTLYDGLRVQQVMDAARRSSDGAGWVKLPKP